MTIAQELFDDVPLQLVSFIGGGKDGQTLMVPFAEGGVCLSVQMEPQVILRRHIDGRWPVSLPVHVEQYVQHVIRLDGRRFAISPDLALSCYREECELPDDQISVEAVHRFRAAVRARVADFGGRVLPPAIGREDISIELLSACQRSTTSQPRRVLRGECWLVTPA